MSTTPLEAAGDDDDESPYTLEVSLPFNSLVVDPLPATLELELELACLSSTSPGNPVQKATAV